MLLFEIFIPITPRPWTVKRGKHFYNTNVDYIAQVKKLLRSAFKTNPYDCPIMCSFVHYLPIPRSVSKRQQIKYVSGEMPHLKRPDTTNLNKQIEDCLTGIVFKDDRQVVKIKGYKRYGVSTGTLIEVYRHEQND